MDAPWLLPLIRAKFYGACQCGQNGSTFFCSECIGLPFCGECNKQTKEHEGHQVLQVCKVSHSEGINTVILERLLDISYIQRYIINGKTTLFIKQRQDQAQNRRGGKRHKSGNECEICGWLSVISPAKFCSIECKVESWRKEEKTTTGVTEEEISAVKAKRSFEPPAGSDRKLLRRKGIPTRSPFF